MSQLRVLQAMAGAPHGGAEAFFERLVTALHRRSLGQKVVIRRNEPRASRLAAAGLDVVELPFGGMLDFRTGWALRRIVRDYKPHVALTYMSRASAKMPKGPFVHAARLGGYYSIKYFRNCRYLIGISPDIVRWLVEEQGWPREHVLHIPNFVTTERMDPPDRSLLNTPRDRPLVVAAGRLHKNKGFDTLLRALAALPNVHLWLAGDGPEESRLRALALELGVADRVRFLGWREDVPALLAAADVFVCPSRHEPLGSVVLEAWAYGAPLVAAAAQGPRDTITDGVNGLLVGVDKVAELAAAVDKVLKDRALANRLVEEGRKAYEAQYTEARIVDAYMSFLERAAASQA